MKRATSPEFSTSKRSAVSVVSLVNTETGLSETTSPLLVSMTASADASRRPTKTNDDIGGQRQDAGLAIVQAALGAQKRSCSCPRSPSWRAPR